MRLQIHSNIDNNMVRLDFRNSKDKPANAPCYKINKTLADEFVKKYNDQETFLRYQTAGLVGVFSLLGYAFSNKTSPLLGKVFKTVLGSITGFTIGTIAASIRKEHLMDEYNVKQLQ